MKDYLKEILKIDSEIDKIFSEDEKKFIIQERTLVSQTLNTHQLTKEYLISRVECLTDIFNNYDKEKEVPVAILSPGYMDGKKMVELKLKLFNLLSDNLEEGLTYRGVLNKVSTNNKEDYNKVITQMVTIS